MVLNNCVNKPEGDMLIKEIHEGYFGTHVNGYVMARKILRVGYYWLNMESSCFNYVQKCHKCQIYIDKMNLSLAPLNILTTP